ncbi:hypothetical protein FACS189430_09600 [Bacteroidia bacterium]|nr:hypothetical protein FACS189430_09600 [Bacteroidia bacterium]
MKKVSVIILAAIMMASCGGDGLKKNNVFGKVSAICADYALALEANKNEPYETYFEKEDKINKEFRDAIDAEMAGQAGKPIPFAVSKGFKHSNVEVVEVRIDETKNGNIKFGVTFVDKGSEDIYTYARAVAKDGSTICTYMFQLNLSDKGLGYYRDRATPTNQRTVQKSFTVAFGYSPKDVTDFKGIEFIGLNAYAKYKKEERFRY